MTSDYTPLIEAEDDFEIPHRQFAELRGKCPVAHSDAYNGFWLLTKHADVAKVAADYTTYTTTVQNVVPRVAFTGRRAPLHLDPPEQTPYRAAINPLLTADKVARLEPAIRRHIRAVLLPLLLKGQADICIDFSSIFPVKVFAEWMGIQGRLEEQLMSAGPAFIKAVQAFDSDAMKTTSLVLYDMARDLIALRREQPLPVDVDPTSALLAARDNNGEPLDPEMIIGSVRQILVVGIVSPMIMVGT